MNCPSRTDDTLDHPGWNQNPPPLSPDTTARNDFNGTANSKAHRKHAASTSSAAGVDDISIKYRPCSPELQGTETETVPDGEVAATTLRGDLPSRASASPRRPFQTILTSSILVCAREVVNLARFIGPVSLSPSPTSTQETMPQMLSLAHPTSIPYYSSFSCRTSSQSSYSPYASSSAQ